jgi:hypothetical protein
LELTFTGTNTTPGAEVIDNPMGVLFLAFNGLARAVSLTHAAARAFFLIDRIADQGLAYPGRTAFLINMDMIFVEKILQSGQNRIRGCFTQAA